MVQRMSLGWISKTHKRVEFVRMRGPSGKGFAEIAVSRMKGSGPETPDLENFPSDDFSESEQQQVGIVRCFIVQKMRLNYSINLLNSKMFNSFVYY